MKIKRFLIVRADGECRIVTRKPNLGWNEVAFELNVEIPNSWAKITGSIDIQMPDPPEASLTAQVVQEDP
jgi:hypothetical protein